MKKNVTKEKKEIHKCPICFYNVNFFKPIYPKMICINCSNGNNGKILDSLGNEVSFSNIDIYGGFISHHKINNDNNDNNNDKKNKIVHKEEHTCWINNIKCYASEMKFGGIVIQTMN